MNSKIFYLVLYVGLLITACGQVNTNYDNPRICVIDSASLLTEGERTQLNEQIIELEDSIGSQLAILIVPSLNGEKIEHYSLKIANQWGLGRKDYDDGVLITASLNDRQMRIEVGYGLEKIIKDEIAAQILREDMIPNFRNGKYYEGFYSAVDKIKTLIKNNKDLIGQR